MVSTATSRAFVPGIKKREQWALIDGACYILPLGDGRMVLIDAIDYPLVSKYRWYSWKAEGPNSETWYAVGTCRGVNGSVYMHRLLMGAQKGQMVDHEDGNGLNNQRSNLRIATRSQNMQNQRKTRGKSQYKGVTTYPGGKWEAKLKFEGKHYHSRPHSTEEEAARAYDALAIRFFGDFACLNFPKGGG